MASFPPHEIGRRRMLAGAALLGLAACGRRSPMTAAHTPAMDMAQLNASTAEIAARLAPGRLGVGLMNLDSGEVFSTSGEERFPMQSIFKAPMAAAALAEIEAGRLSFEERILLKAMDLSPPASPIADAWPGRADYSVRELFTASLVQSDNTAADVLMARIGGPGAVTAWLTAKHIEEIRIDRYEREIQTEILGLAPFRPAWKGDAAFAAALATVPPEQTRRALATYLQDPRDTATPRSALHFLFLLQDGQLVGAASRRLLLDAMSSTSLGAGRLKAGLPAGSSFAHKTGSLRTKRAVTVMNDFGIATLPDGRRYAMAAFLAGATASFETCEAALAQLGRALVRGVR